MNIDQLVKLNNDAITNMFFKDPYNKSYIQNNKDTLINLAIQYDNGVFMRGLFDSGINIDKKHLFDTIKVNKTNVVIALIYILYNILSQYDLIKILCDLIHENNVILLSIVYDIIINKATYKRISENSAIAYMILQSGDDNNLSITTDFFKKTSIDLQNEIMYKILKTCIAHSKLECMERILIHYDSVTKTNPPFTEILNPISNQSNDTKLKLLKLLVKYGYDLCYNNNDFIISTTQANNVYILQYLIGQKIDPNTQNYKCLRSAMNTLSHIYFNKYDVINTLNLLIEHIDNIYTHNNYFIKELITLYKIHNSVDIEKILLKCDSNSLNYYLNKSKKYSIKYKWPVDYESALYWATLFDDFKFFNMWYKSKRFNTLDTELIFNFMMDLNYKQPLSHKFHDLCGDKFKDKKLLTLQTLCENKFSEYKTDAY